MNTKKFLAFLLASVMVVGSSLTAFAEDSTTPKTNGGTTLADYQTNTIDGTATQEGLVNTRAYRVTLPVIPVTSISYTIDPQGLIAATSGARYGVEATGTGLYFVNHSALDATNEGTKTGLSQTSDEFTLVNKSTFPIQVTVFSKLTAGTSGTHVLVPAIAASAEALSATSPNVYLSYKDNAKTTTAAALSTTEIEKVAVLGDAKAAYSYKYTPGEGGATGTYSYEYDSTGTYEYATLKFSYSGAVDISNPDKWVIEDVATASSDEVRYSSISAPTINVKYKLDEYTTLPTADGYKIDVAGPTAASSTTTTATSTTVTYDDSMVPKMYKIALPTAATALSDITNLKVNGVSVTATDLNSTKNIIRVSKPDIRTALGGESAYNAADTMTFTFTYGGVDYTASIARDGGN